VVRRFDTGIGLLMTEVEKRRAIRLGVVGLGTGSMAAWDGRATPSASMRLMRAFWTSHGPNSRSSLIVRPTAKSCWATRVFLSSANLPNNSTCWSLMPSPGILFRCTY
jgi:hypothetical protein